MKKSLFLSLMAVLSLNAEIFNVSTTSELRDALAAASLNSDVNDTVNLAAGTYSAIENEGAFDARYVHMIGSPDGDTILDGGDTYQVIYALDAKLENLIIQNGKNANGSGSGVSAWNVTIENCLLKDNKAGFWATYGSAIHGNDITLIDSEVTGSTCDFTNATGTYRARAPFYGDRATIINSLFHDHNEECSYSGAVISNDAVIINSLFYNNAGSSYAGHYYGNNVTIFNSVFVDGYSAIYPSSDSSYEELQNNIFINTSYYDRYDRIDSTANDIVSLSDFSAHFVDAANGDYRLVENSPLIDAGADISGYATVLVDKDGNVREQGSAIDIGPYEYGEGTVADVPTAEDILNNPNDYGLYTQEQMDAAVANSAKPVVIVW